MNKIIKCLLFTLMAICLLTACSPKNEDEPVKIKYVKDSLQDITYTYPNNYEKDYFDDDQAAYLLNSNEGLIFIVLWDNSDGDISGNGELKEVNGIKGYYRYNDGEYEYSFLVNKGDNFKQYRICASDKDVFWHIVKSVKIKE